MQRQLTWHLTWQQLTWRPSAPYAGRHAGGGVGGRRDDEPDDGMSATASRQLITRDDSGGPEAPHDPDQIDPPLTRVALRERERAAVRSWHALPGRQRLPAAGGVLLGFVLLQLGMWAVLTDQLARLTGCVTFVAGWYAAERGWRVLLGHRQAVAGRKSRGRVGRPR